MSEKFKTFKKKSGTGMHTAYFSEGTKINNQPVEGKQLLRPGNTVYCIESELGVEGRTQFEQVGVGESKQEIPDPPEDKTPPPVTLELREGKPGWWNVVNPLYPDKPINKKNLRRKQAEELLATLTEDEGDPDANTKLEIDFDELDWDGAVEVLEKLGVEELADEWETVEDLVAAIKELQAG